ncbi:hypothetical protein FPOAC2_03742 [Fusarium poae]|uniref:hypothetical protein n=1 Tax=Fusarium poae TaxID=36050 RepID=UPI001CE80CBA|nr:hypothetical protein FPOAC1_003633 [Fusarium poae]KAG8677609.1 hypothetical protein FPOAC1_003633 [Fusarium poae]
MPDAEDNPPADAPPEEPPAEEPPAETPEEKPAKELPKTWNYFIMGFLILTYLVFGYAMWYLWNDGPYKAWLAENEERRRQGLPPASSNGGSGRFRRSIPEEMTSSVPTISTFTNDAPCNQGAVAEGETRKFLPLCTFACAHGYCPSPCVCTGHGKESPLPPNTGLQACRIQGTEKENDGLCAFACAHGYCPSASCTTGCEETNRKMNKLE